VKNSGGVHMWVDNTGPKIWVSGHQGIDARRKWCQNVSRLQRKIHGSHKTTRECILCAFLDTRRMNILILKLEFMKHKTLNNVTIHKALSFTNYKNVLCTIQEKSSMVNGSQQYLWNFNAEM